MVSELRLVSLLRAIAANEVYYAEVRHDCESAADEIERLESLLNDLLTQKEREDTARGELIFEVERLRAALERIATNNAWNDAAEFAKAALDGREA